MISARAWSTGLASASCFVAKRPRYVGETAVRAGEDVDDCRFLGAESLSPVGGVLDGGRFFPARAAVGPDWLAPCGRDCARGRSDASLRSDSVPYSGVLRLGETVGEGMGDSRHGKGIGNDSNFGADPIKLRRESTVCNANVRCGCRCLRVARGNEVPHTRQVELYPNLMSGAVGRAGCMA